MVRSFIVMLTLALGGMVGQSQSPAPSPAPNPALIRVFVQTDDGGESQELSDRKQSVKDVAETLGTKKKTLAVVDAADKADLVLEILDRSVTIPKVVMGLSPRPGDPSAIAGMNGPVRVVTLRTKLMLGDYTPVFSNKNKPAESPRGWKSAAEDIGNQIEKWIAERRDEILKRR
jgi:hypothetical protein